MYVCSQCNVIRLSFSQRHPYLSLPICHQEKHILIRIAAQPWSFVQIAMLWQIMHEPIASAPWPFGKTKYISNATGYALTITFTLSNKLMLWNIDIFVHKANKGFKLIIFTCHHFLREILCLQEICIILDFNSSSYEFDCYSKNIAFGLSATKGHTSLRIRLMWCFKYSLLSYDLLKRVQCSYQCYTNCSCNVNVQLRC